MKQKGKPQRRLRRDAARSGGSPARRAGNERGSAPIPIAGRRPVEELLRRGIQPESLYAVKREGWKKEEPLLGRCRASGWKIEEYDRSRLDEAAEGLPHQGYVAFIREFPYLPFDEFVDVTTFQKAPLLIALDQIQDAGNLGAILRSAECAGVAGALLPRHRSAGVTSAVMKRSAGAVLHLPICRVSNLSVSLDRLRDQGFAVFGADQEGSRSLYQVDFSSACVIVIGSEGRGLRPGIKRRCDQLISIPLFGKIESLNASAAAAVCFFEAVRQRFE